MEEWLKKTINPTGEEFTDEEAKDQWATLQLLARPEAILDQCPHEADYWDLIFHIVPEWSDMVKYNLIMFTSTD